MREKWVIACEKALRDSKALVVLRRMICGDIQEVIGTTKDGDPIYGETKNSDRLRAIEMLAHYTYGKPVQPLSGEEGGPVQADITVRFVKAQG